MIKTLLVSLGLCLGITLDHSKVRFGDGIAFMKSQNGKVGVVESQRVYKNLPAYRIIEREKVKKGSARYAQLMAQATKHYRDSLKSTSKSQNLVLIVEQGGISGYTVLDVTSLCIGNIQKVKSQKSNGRGDRTRTYDYSHIRRTLLPTELHPHLTEHSK